MQNSLSRQILLSVLGVAMLILALVGVSYAVFIQPSTEFDVVTSHSGDVVLLSNHSTLDINLANLSIMNDYYGKVLSDDDVVIDFDVLTYLPAYSSVSYELVIFPEQVSVSDFSINVRFYLEKRLGEEYRAVPNTSYPISFVANGKNSTLGSPSSSMTLFSSTFSNDSDVTKEYVDHFRLRTWLDEHTDLINSSFDGVYKIQLYSKIW